MRGEHSQYVLRHFSNEIKVKDFGEMSLSPQVHFPFWRVWTGSSGMFLCLHSECLFVLDERKSFIWYCNVAFYRILV